MVEGRGQTKGLVKPEPRSAPILRYLAPFSSPILRHEKHLFLRKTFFLGTEGVGHENARQLTLPPDMKCFVVKEP